MVRPKACAGIVMYEAYGSPDKNDCRSDAGF